MARNSPTPIGKQTQIRRAVSGDDITIVAWTGSSEIAR